ncbi:MAG: hypothetical protein J6X66_08430, partial [Lachnospiraceae bacterium]|nr:hypothetical protein [Lachnospiraceae bacterium]
FGKHVVGKDIAFSDITEFYDTEENINYDAYFQRYRFYTEKGKFFFFHERRERKNDYGPCKEEDAVEKGTSELKDEQWRVFCDLIGGGEVKARKDDASSGDSGPWYYLYWKNDRSRYQVYSFASYGKEKEFEKFCRELAADCGEVSSHTAGPDIELLTLRYRPGYCDMNGGCHYKVLEKNKDGVWTMESTDRESCQEPFIKTICAVSDEDIRQLELFIRCMDIGSLSNRKKSDLFITDYSAWGYSIVFRDTSDGEKKEYGLDEYREYTDEDHELIRALKQRIENICGEVISVTEEED